MHIAVNLLNQQLTVFDADGATLIKSKISTAKNGPGEHENSFCTPRGWHKIRAKIGDGMPVNTVFRARRPTGEIFSKELRETYPNRDWILTRILWLSGLEPGFNRFGRVDSMRRYIYIHGCPDDNPMGIQSSAGCVKVRNRVLLNLFDIVPIGTRVYIGEGESK